MSETLRIYIRVYDLLPPSNLSWILNTLGTGVYHSSIQLPRRGVDTYNCNDPSAQVEIAFGGHDVDGKTGVFVLPAGTAGQRMPGLRDYMKVDVGEIFGEDWEKEFGDACRLPHQPISRPRPTRWQSVSDAFGSTTTLAGPSYAQQTSSCIDPQSTGSVSEDNEEVDWGANTGGGQSGKVTRGKLERAWEVVDQLKSEWTGPSYSLLHKNCNNFTDELLYRLTGRRSPSWINRASWVATSIPCLVPAGWIDEVDEVAPDAPVDSQPICTAPGSKSRKAMVAQL